MLFKDFFPIDQLIQETINKLDKIKKQNNLPLEMIESILEMI